MTGESVRYILTYCAIITLLCACDQKSAPSASRWELILVFSCSEEDAPCEPNNVVVGSYGTQAACDERSRQWTSASANPTGALASAPCKAVQ